MSCLYCGTAIQRGRFCNRCGRRLPLPRCPADKYRLHGGDRQEGQLDRQSGALSARDALRSDLACLLDPTAARF